MGNVVFAADCLPGRQVDDAFLAEVVRALVEPTVPEGASAFAVAALRVWMAYENSDACWNPLATTRFMAGATTFNAAGVRNYADATAGVEATAQTLNLAFYADIRKMLARQDLNEAGLSTALKKWTGSEGYADELGAEWRSLYAEEEPSLGCTYGARFMAQSPYPTLWPEQPYELWFELENTGSCTWRAADGYGLLNTVAAGLGEVDVITTTLDIEPGESYRWQMPLVAPSQVGVYTTAWQMAHQGHRFGDGLWIRVSVVEKRDADNRVASANALFSAAPQVHRLTPAGDEDWFRFDLSQRSQVVISTTGESGDTQLWLYGEQGQAELAYNDDAEDSYFSQIKITCGKKALLPGEYFVKVAGYDPTQVVARYEIMMVAQVCPALDTSPVPHDPTEIPLYGMQPAIRYQIGEPQPACGGIIAFQLIPSDEDRLMRFRMTKCDHTPIRANGNLSIVIDGIYSVGPYRYYSGEMGVDGWIDPVGELGLSGEHRYEAYVYPDGQDYPIISGVVLAWDSAN